MFIYHRFFTITLIVANHFNRFNCCFNTIKFSMLFLMLCFNKLLNKDYFDFL